MTPLDTLLGLMLALSAAPMAAAIGNHQFFVHVFPLLVGRMDPIIFPGKVGGHTHSVYGANNFREVLNTPEDMLKAECSTASVQADKSNYWAPTVYFVNDDGKYEPILNGGGRAYYNVEGDKTQPFPPGLRMIAGTAMSRNPYSQSIHAISQGFGCSPQGRNTSPFLPNATTYPDGCDMLHTMIIFPSCGRADQKLDDPTDHFSHMAYPVETGGGQVWYKGFDGGKCPPSHPIKYPNIHLELYYKLSNRQKAMWKAAGKNKPTRFILATGDTTGLSYHADFVNGWEPKVLKDAIDLCDNRDNEPGSCPPLKASLDFDKAHACRYAGLLPAEDQGYVTPLDRLPGCNPRWDQGQGDNHPMPPNCGGAVGNPGWTAPNVAFTYNGNDANPIPVAVNADGDLTKVRPTPGDDTRFEIWGKESARTIDPNHFYKGTVDDYRKNTNLDTAVNKKNKCYGFENAPAYTSLQPTTPAPPSSVYVINNNIPAGVWIGNGVSKVAPPK